MIKERGGGKRGRKRGNKITTEMLKIMTENSLDDFSESLYDEQILKSGIDKKKNKGAGVGWILPNRKRPIAYTTQATSDYIDSIAKRGDYTMQQVYDKIGYDPEAKKVLKLYIDKGYGDKKYNKVIRGD